jgi:hypothetical protein
MYFGWAIIHFSDVPSLQTCKPRSCLPNLAKVRDLLRRDFPCSVELFVLRSRLIKVIALAAEPSSDIIEWLQAAKPELEALSRR